LNENFTLVAKLKEGIFLPILEGSSFHHWEEENKGGVMIYYCRRAF